MDKHREEFLALNTKDDNDEYAITLAAKRIDREKSPVAPVYQRLHAKYTEHVSFKDELDEANKNLIFLMF